MTTLSEKVRLGERGLHAYAKDGQIDLRVFQRDFALQDVLHATWRGIELSKDEWFALVEAAPAINASVVGYMRDNQEPSLFQSLGQKGTHVQVNLFNDMLLVQIRVYSRSFHDPGKLFPTKKGIALKQDEWTTLHDSMKALSARLVA
jgi:hypothetical protein